jgi:enoyl-CoA hydratase/carnithine racemase
VHQSAENPLTAAMELAASLAASSPTSIRCGLLFVHETRSQDWETAGTIARRIRNEIFESPDLQEGIRAFRERREPKWPSLESGPKQ